MSMFYKTTYKQIGYDFLALMITSNGVMNFCINNICLNFDIQNESEMFSNIIHKPKIIKIKFRFLSVLCSNQD
ncbi:hypothetical protein BpHYR1_024888 [Brachionus plicatilis]|uniref:Uncharacterized protein n=1 Tax=Brachionus plicatilis TaxID=10195 RepID=A0A3M7PG96_BRAPC|nr:hypothetical protein BpHYR1_024888 [Brachionus plicatilis]